MSKATTTIAEAAATRARAGRTGWSAIGRQRALARSTAAAAPWVSAMQTAEAPQRVLAMPRRGYAPAAVLSAPSAKRVGIPVVRTCAHATAAQPAAQGLFAARRRPVASIP